MHANYKTDEKVLKEIVKNHVKCTDNNYKINLIVYYRNKKTSNLVIKNNLSPPKPYFQNTDLVYAFKCPMSHPKVTLYVGYTQTTLHRRLQSHTQQGSIKEHFHKNHNIKVTSDILRNNTQIIAKAQDKQRLTIKEALLISQHAPIINKQFDNFNNTLKLFKSNNSNEPSLPIALYTPSQQPNTDNAPSPVMSCTHQPDNLLINSSTLDLVTLTHPISPNINNRINQLINISSNNNLNSPQPTTSSLPLPPSPPLLRSLRTRTANRHLSHRHLSQ